MPRDSEPFANLTAVQEAGLSGQATAKRARRDDAVSRDLSYLLLLVLLGNRGLEEKKGQKV